MCEPELLMWLSEGWTTQAEQILFLKKKLLLFHVVVSSFVQAPSSSAPLLEQTRKLTRHALLKTVPYNSRHRKTRCVVGGCHFFSFTSKSFLNGSVILFKAQNQKETQLLPALIPLETRATKHHLNAWETTFQIVYQQAVLVTVQVKCDIKNPIWLDLCEDKLDSNLVAKPFFFFLSLQSL